MGSLMGSPHFCCFSTEGPFGHSLSPTFFYPPRSARAYIFPSNLSNNVTFAAAPSVSTPFVRGQGRGTVRTQEQRRLPCDGPGPEVTECIYIYIHIAIAIYIYICIAIYIYIYIYIRAGPAVRACRAPGGEHRGRAPAVSKGHNTPAYFVLLVLLVVLLLL